MSSTSTIIDLFDQALDALGRVTGRRGIPRSVRSELTRARKAIANYQNLFPNQPWVTSDLTDRLDQVDLKFKSVQAEIKRLAQERKVSESVIRASTGLDQLGFDIDYLSNLTLVQSSRYQSSRLENDPRYRVSTITETRGTTASQSTVPGGSDSGSVFPNCPENTNTAQIVDGTNSHHKVNDLQDPNVFSFTTLDGKIFRATKGNKLLWGSFGSVSECDVFPDDAKSLGCSKVARKELRPTRVNSSVQAELLTKLQLRSERETKTWINLKHPNIALFLGHTSETPQALVSEWYGGGSIFEYSRDQASDIRLQLICGTAAGLKYLHEKNIVHGDLGPSNIMVDSKGQARIIDFGGSFIPQDYGGDGISKSATPDGTMWIAPERVGVDANGLQRYTNISTCSDVYSFGLVSIHVITQKLPYPLIDELEFYVELRDAAKGRPSETFRPTQREDWPKWESDQLWDLLENCWAIDPTKRQPISYISNGLSAISPKPS